MREALATTSLPVEVDEAALDSLLVDLSMQHWTSLP
jgi:hypothetical protein